MSWFLYQLLTMAVVSVGLSVGGTCIIVGWRLARMSRREYEDLGRRRPEIYVDRRKNRWVATEGGAKEPT